MTLPPNHHFLPRLLRGNDLHLRSAEDSRTQTQKKEKTMKKFEYYSIHIRPGEDAVRVLDDYGADGWEAFHMMQIGEDIVVYLKREKP